VDATSAAAATGVIGAMQVVGRAVFAPLEGRFSSTTITVGVFALHAVAGGLLLTGESAWAIGGFIVLFGAAQGIYTLLRPSLIADLYGLGHYGRISSVMALLLTLAGTSAPLAAGLMYDQFGDYQLVLWGVVGLACAATGVMLLLTRTARMR
jgi:MFS family permease